MHRQHHGSTGEQIHALATQLTSARPGQRKAKPAGLDESMDFIEQLRDLLDLVEDDPASVSRGNSLPQQCGTCEKLEINVGRQ
jgi:hypothetical protein